MAAAIQVHLWGQHTHKGQHTHEAQHRPLMQPQTDSCRTVTCAVNQQPAGIMYPSKEYIQSTRPIATIHNDTGPCQQQGYYAAGWATHTHHHPSGMWVSLQACESASIAGLPLHHPANHPVTPADYIVRQAPHRPAAYPPRQEQHPWMIKHWQSPNPA